jgi:hypothetical protein
MKKFLVALTAAAFIASAPMAFACDGPDCGQVVDDASPMSEIHGGLTIVPSPGDNYGFNTIQDPESQGNTNGNVGAADVTLSGSAYATGQDTWKTEKVYMGNLYGWGRLNSRNYRHIKVLDPGTAEAYGKTDLDLTSDVDIDTNGFQYNSGLSYSHVTGTTRLDIEGEVWAKGDDRCLQEASINVDGSITAAAYGTSYVEGPNGSFAHAGGIGMTTVYFSGHEYDYDTRTGWLSPNKAFVDFDSTIVANQEIFTASYVSKSGATAANLAFVGGGYATSDLGRDGIFGQDDIELTGISASGRVGQGSKAVDGGNIASGNSHAFFSGANGTVNTPRGWCGPDQTANVGGYAVVAGYNNVDVQANQITVTSVQYAKSTTGNTINMDNTLK